MASKTQRLAFSSSRTNSFSSTGIAKSGSFLRPESPTLTPSSENIQLTNSSETVPTLSGVISEITDRFSKPSTELNDISNKSLLNVDVDYSLARQPKKTGQFNISNKKQNGKMSDHQAAAIEIGSTNMILSPAPAAGMYWSRCLTYGHGPSKPIRAHTANLVGEKLYVFGGCDTSSCFNILYILDMDTMTWSKPRLSGHFSPPSCRAHSCTVVERETSQGKKSHQLFVFGGGNGPEYFHDVFVFDIDTLSWTQLAIDPQSKPPKRRAHTSCLWDNKLFVIGGGDGVRALDDVYMLDLSASSEEQQQENPLAWELVQTEGNPPPPRGYHTSNLVKDKLVVFGGSDGHDCFDDVYVLDLSSKTWTQIGLEHKVSRLAHTSTQVGSYVFVIGGHDGRRYCQDILLFNLVTMAWEVRKIYGAPPTPRGYHTTVLYDSRLYIIGGYDGKNVFDDVYMLELSACAYLPQITNFEIDI